MKTAQADVVADPTPGNEGGLKILFVDDHPDRALVTLLQLDGFVVDLTYFGQEALAAALKRTYDAIILDLHLPDMFGLTVLARLAANTQCSPVIVVTGCYGEDEMERIALKHGASAFLRKPLLYEDIRDLLQSVIRRRSHSAKPQSAKSVLEYEAFGFVVGSEAGDKLVRWISKVGPTSAPVLVTGESGVGKELAARALHRASPRSRGPFIAINCGALPDGLFESELFGHARGAFTGAMKDKAGLMETANGGTFFLDEIADLPLFMQVRLLRALEDAEVRRVGETEARRVDCRIIAATNRSVREEVKGGRFREDLFFRLAVATCHIPPLRERREDIEPLIRFWLRRISEREHIHVPSITPGALSLLQRYSWPGNVRELRNVLHQSIVCSTGDVLTESDIAASLPVGPIAVASTVNPIDADECLTALQAHQWNRTAAARSLGIDRTTLWRRLKRAQSVDPKDDRLFVARGLPDRRRGEP